LVYDPIIRWERGGTAGMQALLPDGAASALLATRGMLAVDMAVLGAACVQLRRWEGVASNAMLSVPLDATSLSDPDWCAQARRVILESSVNAHRIEFALTPHSFIGDGTRAQSNFDTLSDEFGVSLGLLGFGTANASLATFNSLPVLRLEVDFESAEGQGEVCGPDVLAGLSQLCRSLGTTLSINAVQNLKQLTLARSLGCEFVRGPVFAKPMLADAALAWLSTSRSDSASWR